MGTLDLERLFEIAKYANSFPPFHFNVDLDTKNSNNTILINEYGNLIKQPISKEMADQYRSQGFKPFVPDLLDLKHGKIIEYQEEPVGRTGVLRRRGKINKKGHDEFSDEDKAIYYGLAGFMQLKVWESDQNWMEKVEDFLK